MIRFQIKKVFFDCLDNFVGLLLSNFLFSVLIFGTYTVLCCFKLSMLYGLVFLSTVAFLAVMLFAGISGFTYNWSNYKKEGIRIFFTTIKNKKRHILFFFLIVFFLFSSVFIIFFYRSLNNLLGLFIVMVLIWIVLIMFLALQFYFPLAMNFKDDKPSKTLKKCFYVLGDNLGFSVFLFFRSVIDLIISLPLFFLVPGFCTISLSQMDSLKLLLIRYNYLEQNSGKNRKNINLKEMLQNEEDAIGPRKFKNIFFPWK